MIIDGIPSDNESQNVHCLPGPQPWNRIAPTAQEQLARVFAGIASAPNPLDQLRQHKDELRHFLLDLLSEDIGALAALVAERILQDRQSSRRAS